MKRDVYQKYLALLLVFVSLQAVAEDDLVSKYSKTVKIVAGQTKILYFKGVSRVAIGHPEIANAVSTEADEILLTGLRPGITDIRVWTDVGHVVESYLLHVIDNSFLRVKEELGSVLSLVEGITVREDNGTIFVEGRVLRGQDNTLIEELRKNLDEEVKKGMVVFNVASLDVAFKQMIMLDVRVVEIRRNDLKNLGVQWEPSIDGPLYAAIKDGSTIGLKLEDDVTLTKSGVYLATALRSQINLLESRGVARVLAQPKLTTRSGSKAEFLGGGEVPIPIIDSDGRSKVLFKKVGVILEIEPLADPEGFIEAVATVEVRAIDPSVEVLGIPGFTTRKTVSEFNVQSGQTMVLSGMLTADDSKNLSALPGLSKLPIIGELFKSRDFVRRSTELVVFVTPYLVEPDGQKNQEMIDYAKDVSRRAESELKFHLMD